MSHTIESIESELDALALSAFNLLPGQEVKAEIASILKVSISELNPEKDGSRSRKIFVESIPSMWDISFDFYAGDSIKVPTWPTLAGRAYKLLQKYNPTLLFIPQWDEEDGEYSGGEYVSLTSHQGVTSWGEEYEVLDENHFIWLSEPNEVIDIDSQFAPTGWQCAKRLDVN